MTQDSYGEFGHYRYRGRRYFDKFDAFEAALACGDRVPDIAFCFQGALDDLDCTIEPEPSLGELYRRRAQALRERYDHLILMYSGGADSHQALMTFLRNGIHLDEVCHVAPLGFAERLDGAPRADDPLALLHEHRLAALPGLRQASLMAPRTRIRVIDNTRFYLGDMPVWSECPHAQRPTGGLHGLYHAVRSTSTAVELQRRVDALGGRRVAVIYGAEKPYLRLNGNDLHLFFSDQGRVGIQNIWHHRDALNFRPVMFYWGDPLIPLKQGHVIKRALESKPEALADVRRRGVNVYVTNGIPGIDHGLIYPDWDHRYQQRNDNKGSDAGVLPAFLGCRPLGIADARDRYYNDRYGALRITALLTNATARVRLSEHRTRLYRLGTLRPLSGNES